MSEDGDHTDAEEIIVQPELGAQEVEIETERAQSPEEILPDIKNNKPSVPPLRPLTIAPKPAKVPIAALKPVTGQQLLLVQGKIVVCFRLSFTSYIISKLSTSIHLYTCFPICKIMSFAKFSFSLFIL